MMRAAWGLNGFRDIFTQHIDLMRPTMLALRSQTTCLRYATVPQSASSRWVGNIVEQSYDDRWHAYLHFAPYG
jgi:hypothetical protein